MHCIHLWGTCNDNLIAVKANPPNLFNEIARQFEQTWVLSVQPETEETVYKLNIKSLGISAIFEIME
jgi:hypothetical protein